MKQKFISLGLALAMLINPAQGVDLSMFQSEEVAAGTTELTAVGFITGLFSDNIFAAFAEGNLLQTMVAAMIDRLTYRSFVLNMNSSKPYRAEFAAQSDSTQTD